MPSVGSKRRPQKKIEILHVLSSDPRDGKMYCPSQKLAEAMYTNRKIWSMNTFNRQSLSKLSSLWPYPTLDNSYYQSSDLTCNISTTRHSNHTSERLEMPDKIFDVTNSVAGLRLTSGFFYQPDSAQKPSGPGRISTAGANRDELTMLEYHSLDSGSQFYGSMSCRSSANALKLSSAAGREPQSPPFEKFFNSTDCSTALPLSASQCTSTLCQCHNFALQSPSNSFESVSPAHTPENATKSSCNGNSLMLTGVDLDRAEW